MLAESWESLTHHREEDRYSVDFLNEYTCTDILCKIYTNCVTDNWYICHSATRSEVKSPVHSGQETLTLASLFLASDYSLESQRWGAALLAQDDRSRPYLSLPLPSLPHLLFWLASLLGIVHTACQKAFHQSSMRPHSYCVALRGRRCVRALGHGGSGASGRTANQPARGLPLVSVLFFPADPFHFPPPRLHAPSLPPPSRLNCSQRFSLPGSTIVQL